MRLPSRKRLVQSQYELARAVFFSFFLHAAVVFVSLLLHFLVLPKTFIPPSYQVKLVGLPQELTSTPAAGPAPSLPKKETMPDTVKPSPKLKKAAEPKKTAPKKDSVPELARQKPKSTQQERPGTAPTQPSTAPSVTAAGATKAAGKAEGVAVSTTLEQYKSNPYLVIIRNIIEQNWNPPPGVTNTRVKVLFSILRSGRVGDSELEQSSGNTYFDLAARRAILLSSPFPRLPEEFYQESVMFSVDLMEKE